MKEITENSLKEKVETLSREYGFPISNLFVAKDDYSSKEIESLGLMRRPEILIGCKFTDESESKKVSLEYRLFRNVFDSFIAKIVDKAFKGYPATKRLCYPEIIS